MLNKNLKNIKSDLIASRMKQSKERSKDTEDTHKSADLTSANYKALFSKCFSHDANGLPDEIQVEKLLKALESGDQVDFDALTRAGTRKLANPQAALSVELSGADPEGVNMPAPPALNSREAAAEMMETYEKSVLRRCPFHTISSDTPQVELQRALDTLNSYGEAFTGPKIGGVVTRKSLFRGNTVGDLVGPYISQFMHLDVKIGNHTISQKGPTKAGSYGITEQDWLEIQNGNVPVPQVINSELKYIYNPRQLGSFVHADFVYQAHLYAASILVGEGAARQSAFVSQTNEGSFVDNGGVAEIAAAVGEISRHALKATWVQKWRKHMRLRPEEMAGRIVKIEDGTLSSSALHEDIFRCGQETIDAVKDHNLAEGGEEKAWMPLQYAEGSPTHPSYPAGHGVIAGACSTILKIYFADAAWSTLGLGVVESLDGSQLDAYTEADAADITIHGEINKLASNMTVGRDTAGIHYRSDGDQGMILGEKVAVQWFKDTKKTYNVDIGEISFVGFAGNTITI